MKKPSDSPEELRAKIIGLGALSMHKSYYPQLREQLCQAEESKAYFQAVFNSISDAIFLHDGSTFHIIDVNEAASRMFGYTMDELMRLSILDLSEGGEEYNQDKAVEKLQSTLRQGQLCFQWRSRKKNGDLFWTEVNSRHATIGQRNLILVALRDISERKKDELDHLEMERRLLHSQKLESLGILAGGIAHDFNNILTAIVGNLDIALLDLESSSPARDSMVEALTASRRASDLVRQMLAYSGRGRFLIKEFDLSLLVEEMVQLLRISISKNVVLHLDFEKQLPFIQADQAQIQQIVMNLITNASEAIGDKQGTISLTVGIDHFGTDLLDQSRLAEKLPEGRYVFLKVEDTGCGMTPGVMDRLFDPFFTTKFTGRGLGMSAVLGIVRGHKGAIFIRSEPGVGTQIQVLFPLGSTHCLANTDNGHGIASATALASAKGSGIVLVVDDEPQVLSLAKRMLTRMGFRVLVASDGSEALAIFETSHSSIDCVLLDLTMPKMDGMQTYRKMHAIAPKTPAIISSGFDEFEVSQKFEGEGLAGFIQKPFQYSDLEGIIQKALEQQQSGF